MSFVHDRFIGILSGNIVKLNDNIVSIYKSEEGGSVSKDIFYNEYRLAVEAVLYEFCSEKKIDLGSLNPVSILEVVDKSYNKVLNTIPDVIAQEVSSLLR